MNLRSLKYLVQAAELEHFGRAAECCDVSQPTLSQQLRKLEKELDLKLFRRQNRGVSLTPAGREVTEQAKNVLREYKKLLQLGGKTRHPEESLLRLGLFPTIAPYLLPKILPRLRKRYPRLNLQLFEEKTARLYHKLQTGTLDAALLALPVTVTEIESTEILREPFLLTLHRNHPLSSRQTINIQELCKQRLLLLEEGHCLREQVLDLCRATGLAENGEFRATSLETLKQMVSIDAGVTLTPRMAATRHPEIRYVPLAEPSPSRRIGLVWRHDHFNRSFYTKLADLLRKCL